MSVPRLLRTGLPLFCLSLSLIVALRRQGPGETDRTAAESGGFFLTKTAAGAGLRADSERDVPAERRAAVERLKEEVPGVRVDFDRRLHTPQFVASTESFLTKGQERTGGAAAAKETVARFLEEHRDLFGHGSGVLGGARMTRDYVTEHNGMHTMVWQQEHGGIRVFESTLQAHVTKDGALVNIASRMLPSPERAAAAGMPDAADVLTHPPVSARQAVGTAAGEEGDLLTDSAVTAATAPEGAAQKQTFDARPLLNEASAQLVWLPADEKTMRLCWEVLTVSRRTGWMHRTLVDAGTGAVERRQSLTEALSPASYRVFTSDSPQPMSPGHATPLTTEPAQVTRELVTLEALNATASPNGWINDGGNETLGNNVDAHLDLNFDNVADTPRPQGSPARVFDPGLNLPLGPGSNRPAAVVNLFYWTNLAHDRLYSLGFTEAAGNFQVDNFGRGGAGNDAVMAEAQDGRGTNNAYFSTPPDGAPGRMEMLIFTGPSPDRDASFDAELILHEYAHGVSNRLAGGGVGISALQSRAMGEGWSDFYALSLLSEPGDDPDACYAPGAFSTQLRTTNFLSNYYFGIRRYPYSSDQRKSPLTFKDIDPSQAGTHPGVPRSPLGGGTADEEHNAGEVWCAALWDARAHLAARHGVAAGNDLMLRLVTDGLKLSPANPTYLQARDAILQAELVYTGGANRGELWSAFAGRGMGSGAVAPGSSTTSGVVEKYSVPDALSAGAVSSWTPSMAVGGSGVSRTWILTNTGPAPLDWTAQDSTAWVSFSPPGGSLAPGASVTVTANVTGRESLTTGSYNGRVIFTDLTSGLRQVRMVHLTVEPQMNVLFEENWESGAVGSQWAVTGTGTHQTMVTTFNQPFGGSYHLTMDSSTSSLAREELTLTQDLTGRQRVQLSFWIKMFSDEPHGPPTVPFTGGANFDGVAVSADGGTTWYEVQPLRTVMNAWQQITVDLDAAIAARGLSYTSNFKIRFNHYGSQSITSDGFAIDDIRLAEVFHNRLTLTFPGAATEGDAPVTGTLSVAPVPAADVTVSLMGSPAGEVDVPATVTVPAGTAQVAVSAAIVDDALLDGTQGPVITATATGYPFSKTILTVHDNETAPLTVTLPAAAVEGGAGATGSVSIPAPAARDVTVLLQNSDPVNLTAPAQAVIPAGQTSANFTVSFPEDTVIDGTLNITITASVQNWTAGSAVTSVADNESTALTVSIPGPLSEGYQAVYSSVSIGGTMTQPLTVFLTANPGAEMNLPASAVIPAGQTTGYFYAGAADDTVTDGTQTVVVTASAPGFNNGTQQVTILDNDVHRFTFYNISSPQIRGASFTIAAAARDINDVIIGNYAGAPVLTAAAGGQAVPLTIFSSSTFSGILYRTIRIGAFATGIVLTLDDGQGHTGQSVPFDTVTGPLHHFGWSSLGSQLFRDTLYPATVTAQDLGNNTVTDFNGTATLATYFSGGITALPAVPGTLTFSGGVWTGQVAVPILSTQSSSLVLRATAAGPVTGDSNSFSCRTPPLPQGTPDFALSVPPFILEGGAPQDGTITLPAVAATDTVFTLASSAPLKLTVPNSVTVAAGATSATFAITPLNDSFADGDKSCFITATPPAGTAAAGMLTVIDDELASFTVAVPDTAAEGGSAATGTLTLSNAVQNETVITLISSDAAQAFVPATVTVAARQTTASFSVTPVNDTIIDGPVTVTITGSRANGSAASDTITITDNETKSLSLAFSGNFDEGTTVTGAVNASGIVLTPLTVNLTSSLPARFSVPASVTIPAGSSSAPLSVTLTENTTPEEAASVTMTANADGFTGTTRIYQVRCNDPASFGVSILGAQREAGVPLNTSITARTPAGQTTLGFKGSVTLSAAGTGGPIGVTPAEAGPFSGGVWTGDVTFAVKGTGVRLTATGAGATGMSSIFNVLGGPLAYYEYTLGPGPWTSGEAIPLTIRAMDANNNPTTNGVVSPDTLHLTQPYRQCGSSSGNVSPVPMPGGFVKSRTQTIYPVAEIGSARRLTGLALNMLSIPALTNWTIRLKHTTLSTFSTESWDTDEWTVVYTGGAWAPAPGWVSFNFTKPWNYDGERNIMVDFSYDQQNNPTNGSNCACDFTGGARTLNASTLSMIAPSPLLWSGAGGNSSMGIPAPVSSNTVPHVRFLTPTPTLTPGTVALTNGMWSGNLTVGSGESLILRTDFDYYRGTGGSSAFTVLPQPGPQLVITNPDSVPAGAPRGTVPSATPQWMLYNPGSQAVNWKVATNMSWTALSATEGTLPPGRSTPVTLTYTPATATLPLGSYSGSVSFETIPATVWTSVGVNYTVQAGGILSISGNSGADASGPAGGPFTPVAHSWSVSNSGNAAMDWSAASAAPWLTLSPPSGSLAGSAAISVNGQITTLANALWPGEFAGSLQFTNVTTGVGSAARGATLRVAPVAALLPEPSYTGGTTNTLALPFAGEGVEYEFEMDTAAGFTAPVSSGWMAMPAYTFNAIPSGQNRYFRGRSRTSRARGVWSQHTTAALTASTVRSATVPDATGIVLESATGGMLPAARITNEGFENGTANSITPAGTMPGWTLDTSTWRMPALLANTVPSGQLPSEGGACLMIYCYTPAQDTSPFAAGAYSQRKQTVDLTGATALVFDAKTTGSHAGVWSGAIAAQVRLDGNVVWSKITAGTWLNQSVPLTGFTGSHAVELRMEALSAGSHPDHQLFFDNLRLTAPNGLTPAGTVTSPAITAPGAGVWGQLVVESDIPGGTSLSVEVLDGTGTEVLAAGLGSGADLSSIPALQTLDTLQLRARLASSNAAVTPRLRTWAVTHRLGTAGTTQTSAWSATVSSTQDATMPQCEVTSASAASAAAFVLTGTAADLSGVAGVTVNGQSAATTDGFASWSLPVTLQAGVNSFTVTAADNAVPPNTKTVNVTVTLSTAGDSDGDRMPDDWETAHGLNPADATGPNGPHGDGDGDGLPNLMEYALVRDPRVYDAGVAPVATRVVNPADQSEFLEMTYRRRGAGGFIFKPVHSGDFNSWSDAGFQEVSSVPAGDGVTEVVTVRLAATGRRFVRVEVIAP